MNTKTKTFVRPSRRADRLTWNDRPFVPEEMPAPNATPVEVSPDILKQIEAAPPVEVPPALVEIGSKPDAADVLEAFAGLVEAFCRANEDTMPPATYKALQRRMSHARAEVLNRMA